jgi:hypothetical protein
VEENLAEWIDLPQDSAVFNNVAKGKGDDSMLPSSPTATSTLSPKATALAQLTGIAKLEMLKAENFRPESDFFLVTVFGMTSFRTKVIKKNFEGAWNASILLVLRENEKNYLVKFSIYSLNKFGQNDLIAYCTLKMTDVIQHPNGFTIEIPMVFFYFIFLLFLFLF